MARKKQSKDKPLLAYGYFGNLRGEWLRENQPDLFQALQESDELDSYLLSYQKSFSIKSYRLFQKYEEQYGIDEVMFRTNFIEYIKLERQIAEKVRGILKSEIEQP